MFLVGREICFFIFFFHFPKTEKLVVPCNNPALKVFHEMLDGLD